MEKDANNVKGLYRLGVAYTRVGELNKAREALNKVLNLESTDDMKRTAEQALKEVENVESRNKTKEKQMLQRMFKPKIQAKLD